MRTVPGKTDSVVIIGAGLGGLSAALHLAAANRNVTVIEREAIPGGRAGLIRDHGYHFDTGPAVLTMPDLLARPFNAVGENLEDHLTLHRLDPAYRAKFADGSSIDLHAHPEAMAEEIRAKCSAKDVDGYSRLLAFVEKLYRIELPHFIDRNLDSPRDLAAGPLAQLAMMGAFRHLAPKINGFVTDERLRRLFTFQSMYAGLAPAQALAIYSVITYMDSVQGVYFPDGGMHAIPRTLADVAVAHGVDIRYNTRAIRIEISGRRASAVITSDGGRIPADVVVVNADLPTAYAELLPPGYTPRRVKKLRYSPAAVVLHLGASTRFDDTLHHTIDFGAAWDTTFKHLHDGRTMTDPSFLLTTPTHTDRNLAPQGRHTYSVLFPAPNLDPRHGSRRIDWREAGARYRDHMLDTLDARGYQGLRDGIECEFLLTPADWRAQGIAAGAPFGAAHTFAQTGPFRAATLDRNIENLVFAGSNTQPGVGVPMVLISGELAAQRITDAVRG